MEDEKVREINDVRAEEIINKIKDAFEEIRVLVEQMKDRLGTR